jgi:cardiolipin synthase
VVCVFAVNDGPKYPFDIVETHGVRLYMKIPLRRTPRRLLRSVAASAYTPSSALPYEYFAKGRPKGYTTQARYIPCRDYGPTLVEEINKARTSVTAYLYLFALYPNRTESQTMRIASALAAAKARGVRVEVVLDKGAFVGGDPVEALQADNRETYEFLRAQGIDVFFSDTGAALHAKAVVIDSLTVIVGSANWSESAFMSNIEASVLVQSRSVALSILADLGRIPRKRLPLQDTATALVPVTFLTDTTRLGRMVTVGDERVFDVYMFLCKLIFGVETPWHVVSTETKTEILLDYDTLARYLGIDSMTPVDFRRQINKTLDKLQDRYGLAKVTTAYGKPAQVRLTDAPGPWVAIPSAYWAFGGWQKRLAFAGKVMEILNLHYSGISAMRPRWSASEPTLASRHNVSIWFLQQGIVELRRANLLDVDYDSLPEKSVVARRPSIYTPLTLYDPLLLDKKWAELETRYGKEITARGRACAALVLKDCDWRAVEQFIMLEQKYGRERIEKAASIIRLKAVDNPHRSVGYFVGTVSNLP